MGTRCERDSAELATPLWVEEESRPRKVILGEGGTQQGSAEHPGEMLRLVTKVSYLVHTLDSQFNRSSSYDTH